MSRPGRSTDRLGPTGRAAVVAGAAALAVGCAHGEAPGWRSRPGRVDARSWYYADNSGLRVSTTALSVAQPVSRALTAGAQGVIDRIEVEREPLEVEHQAGNQATGHHHDPDMVTSASAFAADGEVATKWRFEGTVDLSARGELLALPSEARASVRIGTEPDYDGVSGALSARTELFERNTTVTASLGYGHDTVSPVEAPPGQAALWPATHDRLTGGVAVSQVLSRSLVASGGVGVTLQRGALENPYRRAIVRTSLFPEQVPDARDRFTGFLGLSWSAGGGAALHLRSGLYVDSWGVVAAIPELALAKDLGGRALVLGRYRFYRQSAADFHRARYDALEPILTGDARLGAIRDHVAGLEARWIFLGAPGEAGAVTALAGYDVSFLTYEALETDAIVAHAPNLGISVLY